MSELIWQLRYPGVVSVWTDGDSLIDKVYTCITHKSEEINGVVFDRHVRVDFPCDLPFVDFCRRLLLSFHSDDFQAKEIREVFIQGAEKVIERCHQFLRENKCLIVIGGLPTTTSWESIKDRFLSDPIKSSILLFGNIVNAKYLDEDNVFCHSVKVCNHVCFSIMIHKQDT
jgi:hypothetical protein